MLDCVCSNIHVLTELCGWCPQSNSLAVTTIPARAGDLAGECHILFLFGYIKQKMQNTLFFFISLISIFFSFVTTCLKHLITSSYIFSADLSLYVILLLAKFNHQWYNDNWSPVWICCALLMTNLILQFAIFIQNCSISNLVHHK